MTPATELNSTSKRLSDMAVKVSPDQLAQAVLKELEVYTEEVEEAVSKAVIAVGREAANELRATTQVAGSNTWNHYPKGWKSTPERRKGKQEATVHNVDHYRLTHLLENGHVIKNGTGRTYGNTRKFPHIITVEKKSVEELEKRIKEAIAK